MCNLFLLFFFFFSNKSSLTLVQNVIFDLSQNLHLKKTDGHCKGQPAPSIPNFSSPYLGAWGGAVAVHRKRNFSGGCWPSPTTNEYQGVSHMNGRAVEAHCKQAAALQQACGPRFSLSLLFLFSVLLSTYFLSWIFSFSQLLLQSKSYLYNQE